MAFELSIAHLLNVIMLNNLSNEVLCCTLFVGADNVACVFPSVPWSQRLIQPLSLAAGLSNTLLFF